MAVAVAVAASVAASVAADEAADEAAGFVAVAVSASAGSRGETPPGTRCSSRLGTLVADGWTAEMAIPFKSLRYPSSDSHRWGFQVVRSISGKDETVVWSPVLRGNSGFMSQMGLLDGLSGLSTSRNLKLLPTFNRGPGG